MSMAAKVSVCCCVVLLCLSPRLLAQPNAEQATPVSGPSDERTDSPYARDRRGLQVRVRFDPASRWWLGSSWAPQLILPITPQRSDAGRAGRVALDTGVAYRQLIELEEGTIAYKLYHRALDAHVWLGPDRGPVQLEATTYRVRFMRWTADGRIMLPTSPPRRVAFPFNIGMDTTVGTVRFAQSEAGDYQADVGVIRSLLLLDPWRQKQLRSFVHLGLGPRYDLRLRSAGEQTVLRHLVAPFTTAAFRFHHESSDGHHAFDVMATGGFQLEVDSGWKPLIEASASYETILVAINDMPVSARLDSRYRLIKADEPTSVVEAGHELSATAGLRLSLPVTW